MHDDDKDWVTKTILNLPHSYQGRVYDAYNKAFADTLESEPDEHRKMNKARREANSRLLAFSKKCN